MSITVNYIRFSDNDDDADAWSEKPNACDEHLYLDNKDVSCLAWLLSSAKREEVRRTNLFHRGKAARLDLSDIKADLFLNAMEGREGDKAHDIRINPEPSFECLFLPSTVEEISDAFDTIEREDFLAHFSPEVMAEALGYPDILEMRENIVEEFFWPTFIRFRTFLSCAVAANQSIAVYYE